jgi:replication factor C subunit 1
MKSTSASSVPKAAKVAPDLEEAIEDDDAEVPLDTPEDVDAPEDDVDVLKDKYIKKPKPANAKAAGGKKGKKASKTLEGEDGASDQAAKPKTARGKKAANTKAKSGK